MSKNQCIVQEYGIINDPYFNDPYIAPELIPKVIFGKVYGHSSIPDSHRIISSPIVNYIDDETIETMNSIYKLGKKSDDYQLFLNNYQSQE